MKLLHRLPAVRNRAFFISDACLLLASAALAFNVRYEGVWTPAVVDAFRSYAVAAIPLKLIALIAVGMYRRLWRYASVTDLEVLVAGALACAAVNAVLGAYVIFWLGFTPQPISVAVILLDSCLGALAIATPRLGARVLARRERRGSRRNLRRALVVGAGAAGGMIVRELAENPQLGLVPVGMLDDDTAKHGLRIQNVPILGPLSSLAMVAERMSATDVVIAMPSSNGRTIRSVVGMATAAGLATRTVPGLYELLSGEKRVDALREVAIEDLLRRDPIEIDTNQISVLAADRVVMVTGAGGSIGRELCRQLSHMSPERIVVLGRGENSIFELLQELRLFAPSVRVDPVIADVRDHARLARVFAEHRPYSVFHAAAHKHVPLMEANVAEAVLNNVLGTQNVVSLAAQYGVENFVLISTDKAVRPSSVMGATKRVAEHIVHQYAREGKLGYVAVRFGNVLGSRGSVVPTFLRQIAAGGPVTITHPDMTRYFMTIPEAVQLVLQAAAIGRHGEVFVLDMGEPVRVADLALDLIRLSGLEPGLDIDIEYTGTRPGEKLFEELFFHGDDVTPTKHPKILRARDAEASEHSPADITALIDAAREGRSPAKIRRLMQRIVPEYSNVVNDAEISFGSRSVSRELSLIVDHAPDAHTTRARATGGSNSDISPRGSKA